MAAQIAAKQAQALRTMHENITVTDMKTLVPIFEAKALFTGAEPEAFPIDATWRKGEDESSTDWHQRQAVLRTVRGTVVQLGSVISLLSLANFAAKLMPVEISDQKYWSVVDRCFRIEKIGLKDAQDCEYIDPFMTVLVADARANILDSRDTNFAAERRATHVMFNQQVYLNVSLEDMERSGAAIFFEFKHYKPKKKKISTRRYKLKLLFFLSNSSQIC
eukprot:Skav230195  [mRNA]  locus=scaffold1418:314816:319000:+ [translate_table: standard]